MDIAGRRQSMKKRELPWAPAVSGGHANRITL